MQKGECITVKWESRDGCTGGNITGYLKDLDSAFFIVEQGEGNDIYIYYDEIVSFNPIPKYNYTKPEPSKYGVFLDMSGKK